jgi:hypothetical protein
MVEKNFSPEELAEYVEQFRIVIAHAAAEVDELEKIVETDAKGVEEGLKQSADKLLENISIFEDNVEAAKIQSEAEGKRFLGEVRDFISEHACQIGIFAGIFAVGAALGFIIAL